MEPWGTPQVRGALEEKANQDGAAMFGRRPGRSAKTMLLFTFLLIFDFYFYTHNV